MLYYFVSDFDVSASEPSPVKRRVTERLLCAYAA